MRPIPQAAIGGLVLLCVLLMVRLRLPASAPRPAPARRIPAPPHTPAEAALRQAWRYQAHAQIRVNQERDAQLDWDPQSESGSDPEAWRLRAMAADSSGDLRRARIWAQRAATLARTPAEACASVQLQVMLDHEMGEHRAELQHARKLLSLAPGSARARRLLRRAGVRP